MSASPRPPLIPDWEYVWMSLVIFLKALLAQEHKLTQQSLNRAAELHKLITYPTLLQELAKLGIPNEVVPGKPPGNWTTDEIAALTGALIQHPLVGRSPVCLTLYRNGRARDLPSVDAIEFIAQVVVAYRRGFPDADVACARYYLRTQSAGKPKAA
jgi:hypothetical protein